MATVLKTKTSVCRADFKEFFDTYIPMIRPMASRMGVNEDYLLALVAFEDSWGRDSHNKVLHNIFGLTHAGKANIAFSSYDSCISYFEAKYKKYFVGCKSIDDFISGMKQIGYNSVNPGYYRDYLAVYRSVVMHKHECVIS